MTARKIRWILLFFTLLCVCSACSTKIVATRPIDERPLIKKVSKEKYNQTAKIIKKEPNSINISLSKNYIVQELATEKTIEEDYRRTFYFFPWSSCFFQEKDYDYALALPVQPFKGSIRPTQ